MKGKIDMNRKGIRRRVMLKIKENDEDDVSNNINKYLEKRKELINQLQMTQLLKKREKLKFDIIENF